MSGEYLIVYEEPEEGEDPGDELFVDVDVHERHVDRTVEAEFGARVTNRAGPVAVTGLVFVLFGALSCIIAAVLFALNYPDQWYPAAGTAANELIIRSVVVLALAGAFLLVIGNLLVGFGRTLHAQGVLHKLHFTPNDEAR